MGVLAELIITSLTDAVKLFERIGDISGKWTPKTALTYHEQLRYFSEWMEGMHPGITVDQISKTIILDYLDEAGKGRRRDKDGSRIPAPYQKRQAFLILRAFFLWCENDDQGYILKSPMRNIKIGSPVERVHIPPTNDEIKLILDSFDGSFIGLRNKAILLTYCNTGARLCELLADFYNNKPGISEDDVFWKSKEIRILGKGNRERIVMIDKPTMNALLAYDVAAKKMSAKNKWLKNKAFWKTEEGKPLQGDGFSESLRRTLRRVEKQTGKKIDMTSHDLRRRVCNVAREAGLTTLEIMDITGHQTEKMVRHYSKTHDAKNARLKLSQHSPVAGL